MNCHGFSTGFSSGDLGGSGIRVMLSGTSSFSERCQPAWSSKRTAWAPGSTTCAISSDAAASQRYYSAAAPGWQRCRAAGTRRRRYRPSGYADHAVPRAVPRRAQSATAARQQSRSPAPPPDPRHRGPPCAHRPLPRRAIYAAWLRSSQATPFIPSSRGRYRAGELLSGLGREGALARACRGHLFCAVITRMTQHAKPIFKVLERKLNKVLASHPRI
jgi:hypothetical protein